MALQLSWTDPETAVQMSSAYARVIGIAVDAIVQTIDLAVGLYATAAARNSGAEPFTVFHAWPSYATFLGVSVDVRTASYLYLKTSVTQFADATDV